MNLNFCCNIWMGWSEFGVNKMIAWIHPSNASNEWCNVVRDVSLAHLNTI